MLWCGNLATLHIPFLSFMYFLSFSLKRRLCRRAKMLWCGNLAVCVFLSLMYCLFAGVLKCSDVAILLCSVCLFVFLVFSLKLCRRAKMLWRGNLATLHTPLSNNGLGLILCAAFNFYSILEQKIRMMDEMKYYWESAPILLKRIKAIPNVAGVEAGAQKCMSNNSKGK